VGAVLGNSIACIEQALQTFKKSFQEVIENKQQPVATSCSGGFEMQKNSTNCAVQHWCSTSASEDVSLK